MTHCYLPSNHTTGVLSDAGRVFATVGFDLHRLGNMAPYSCARRRLDRARNPGYPICPLGP
jgi:hypothetical protein